MGRNPKKAKRPRKKGTHQKATHRKATSHHRSGRRTTRA